MKNYMMKYLQRFPSPGAFFSSGRGVRGEGLVKIMAVIIITSLVAIITLNYAMDPYSIFGVNVKHRPMYLVDKSHITKPVQLIHDKSDTILIGSSIVDAAFKLPGSTTIIYEQDYYNKRKKALLSLIDKKFSVYNAGIRGGGLNDAYNILLHAYKNNPNIKHVILGMEWNFFTYMRRASATVPVTPSLGKTYVPATFYVNNLLSWQVSEDSVKTLLYRIKKLLHDPHFFSNDYEFDVIEEFKNLALKMKDIYVQLLAKYLHKYSAKPIIYHDIEKHLIQGQNEHEMASLLFSIWSLSSLKSTFESTGENAVLNPEAFATLRKIVDFAKEHDIKLDVYVSPQHAVYWEVAKEYGFQSHIDEWLKRLAEITPYWEFSSAIDFSQKVDDYFDTDALHFNPDAAEIILPEIMRGNKMANYVTKDNVVSMIEARHTLASAWLGENLYAFAILSSPDFARTVEIKGDLDKVITTEYMPSYKNYHILKFMGNYIALPVGKAPYDFKLLFTNKMGPFIAGNSVKDVMEQIKSRG